MSSPIAETVRRAPLPIFTLDLATRRVTEVSDPLCELLGQTRERTIGHLTTEFAVDPQRVNATLDLLVDGRVEGYQTRRGIRRSDGTAVDCLVWARRIDDDEGKPAALVIIHPASADLGIDPATTGPGPVVVGVIGSDWRLEDVSPDVEHMLGWTAASLEGGFVLELLHPDHHADLFLALSQVLASNTAVAIRVRLRHADGGWRRIRLVVTPFGTEHPRRYAFVLEPAQEVETEDKADLVERLRRIALEVRATGVVHTLDGAEGMRSLPGVDELSARQREILSKILQGARVPSIARDLFISQSTVRNHLAAIFRKVGVHSQVELLDRVYGRSR